MSVKPNQADSLSSNVVVDGVKGCRNTEEAQTRDLLMRYGRNKFIVQGSAWEAFRLTVL